MDYLSQTASRLDQPWFHVLSLESPHGGRGNEENPGPYPVPAKYRQDLRPEDILLRPNVPEELMEQAREALSRGDHVRALAAGDQLVSLAPDDAAACAIRARILLHADTGEEALSESRRAAELAPEDARVHLFLGLAAWRCERSAAG